ncbi:glycosyltransferase [Lysinibacillus sp. KU-BSD001]|uniref:glycosyltransferase n=1 Tax=Lysinibacillus sp. KU-BSD001 TaxID=3141328 RepID=UPI0036E94674
MKRILVVVDNLNSGGIASVVLNISEAVNKENYIFDYIVYKQPNQEVLQRIENNNGKYFIVKRISETSPLQYVKKIRAIIRENGPYDAIHAHTSSFIWLACLAGEKENIPIRIGHAHGSKNAKQFLFSEALYAILRYFNRKYCTKMISCADLSGQYVFGKGFEFIPNFIDHTQYCKIEKEQLDQFTLQHHIPRDAHTYCFIGYLGGEKNPLFALQVFKRIVSENPHSYLLIAGDGPEFNQIIEFIQKNQLEKNVRMFGNTDKVKEILHLSHMLFMPSFSEGMSMAILEAQIAGVNCIVSSGVPITNDIKAGLFHRCLTFDIEDWYTTIQQVKKNPTVSEFDILNALENIGYDQRNVGRQYERIYDPLPL